MLIIFCFCIDFDYTRFVPRLVVQRTKLIDETQEILLELLEEMTTGKCNESVKNPLSNQKLK